MKKEEKELAVSNVRMENVVMERIKRERITMKSPVVFLAQKLGLQSVLLADIIFSSLLFSVIFYFLKRTKLLKFLAFGWPGLKVVLLSLPYDYIALILISVILANYVIEKLGFIKRISFLHNLTWALLLILSLSIGSFFTLMGAEQFIKAWAKVRKYSDGAIGGKVIETRENEALIRDEEGREKTVHFNPNKKPAFSAGNYLRAVGRGDPNKENSFWAEEVRFFEEEEER